MNQAIIVAGALVFVAAWLYVFLKKIEALNHLDDLDSQTRVPKTVVSVVVPARNEEKTIAGCVESLLSQRGVSVEVIVVDDNSSDQTLRITQMYSDRGVKSVKSGSPPEGWVGKTWACEVGYRHSSGDWLLFTDADTHFSEDVIALALSKAEEKQAELITLYPRLRFNSVLHKLTMPILLTGLYVLGKPHMFQTGRAAFAFGSFILIKREAYEKVGGHRAVRNALLEDRALALRALKAGLRVSFAKAFNKLTSSWNDDSKSLWNGMLRVFIPLMLNRSIKQKAPYIILTSLCLAIPIVILLSGNLPAFLAGYLAASLALGHEARLHSSRFVYGFLWYLGAVAVSAALLTAVVKTAGMPSVKWRGRNYLLGMGDMHEVVVKVC
ncbi:MAG: glycosyltransferase family 2 protein [Candidatus Caldarchaeum sp.]